MRLKKTGARQGGTGQERNQPVPDELDLDKDLVEIYDRTVKIAVVSDPASILKLGGYETDMPIRVANVAVNRAERRADNVLLVGRDSDPGKWAAYLEVQTWPDPSEIMAWQYKHAAIALRTKRETVLLVLYLKKGKYRTFPDGYRIAMGPRWTTSFGFGTIRAWEHADEIRSGKFPGLAPLLQMCYEHPGPEVLEIEREIILQSNLPGETKTELLAACAALGGIEFPAEVIRQVFEKEGDMIKERGVVKEWIDEGRSEGRAEGRADGARQVLLAALTARFGEIPEWLADQVRSADLEWCVANIGRVQEASSVEDFRL